MENAERRQAVVAGGMEEGRRAMAGVEEKLAMVKEDLTGKLLQRADFVAQREELDEMEEGVEAKFGENFGRY